MSTEIAHVTKAVSSSLNDNDPWSPQENLYNSYWRADNWTPCATKTGQSCSSAPRPYTFWNRQCPSECQISGCAETMPLFRQETVGQSSWQTLVQNANMNHYAPGNAPSGCFDCAPTSFWESSPSRSQVAYCYSITQGDEDHLSSCLSIPYPPQPTCADPAWDITSWFPYSSTY